MTTTLRALLSVAALGLLFTAAPAKAQFSTTNVQLIQGYGFNNVYAPDADETDISTLTVNQFSAYKNGDSFFFADLTRSNEDVTGMYAEWHPRLFVNKLLGQKEPLLGIFKNYGAAFEVNYGSGDNFYAYLAGAGVDFAVPHFNFLSLNVFYRYDKFANHQWQISPSWELPFKVGKVPFLFAGFVDVNGTKLAGENELEVWAQPQLLVDVLAPFGGTANTFYVGTEFYYHKLAEESVAVPQLMVQWTVF
jgi:nucleoside-specific outer membrane channel protein Tsx